MSFDGELAAAMTALLWAFSAMLFTLSGRRVGANVVNLTRLGIAAILIGFTHYFAFGEFYPMQTEGWRFWVLALSAVVGLVIGDGALFYAFVLIGPQLSMLIMSLVPVLSVLFAWLCFGELIFGLEYVGILLTMLAVGWVVTERRKKNTPPDTPLPAQNLEPSNNESSDRFVLGVVLALVGALGQTGNLIITKYALTDDYSSLSATEIRILVSFLFLLGWAVFRQELVLSFRKLKDRTALVQLVFGALFGPFLGIWMSYIAIEKGRIGIAATIISTSPLLLLPLSWLILKERLTVRAVVGTVLAMVGVGILCYLNPG